MQKRFLAPDVFILLLAVACLSLGVGLCVANVRMLAPVLFVFILLAIAALVLRARLRRALAVLLHGAHDDDGGVTALPVPMLILSGKNIVWYNDAFRTMLLQGEDACLVPVRTVLKTFDMARAAEPGGMELTQDDKEYTVYGCKPSAKVHEGMYVACFVENTKLKHDAREYLATRPCVFMITIDTYNDVLRDMKDSERARFATGIDAALEQYFGAANAFLRRTGSATYTAVVEQRYLTKMTERRFEILDTVRELGDENNIITLSIGVGSGAATLHEDEQMALQALDMALGRGGDQAAVKTPDGYMFFGGVSRSVEKSSKVKSRIIASALADLIRQSSNVLIMGHKHSDLDAIGAAVGVLRICKMQNVPAHIVVRQKQTLAGPLLERMAAAGFADDYKEPSDGLDMVQDKTLLIVVDTHLQSYVESSELLAQCRNVVVIDHHRRGVGQIENAAIFYHEPYASSASELVSELLAHLAEREDKPTPLDAEALLAGIMLDTREFTIRTGVRTFEAAAFLRRLGAQTAAVKRLFATSLESYAYKAQLVTDAQIYMGCAVVFSEDVPEEMQVAAPQAANDLLTIEGVEASFVAVCANGKTSVSARSLGDMNVQVIMESLGGGGHLAMAGAQFKDVPLAEVKQRVLNAIAAYRETQRKTPETDKPSGHGLPAKG